MRSELGGTAARDSEVVRGGERGSCRGSGRGRFGLLAAGGQDEDGRSRVARAGGVRARGMAAVDDALLQQALAQRVKDIPRIFVQFF